MLLCDFVEQSLYLNAHCVLRTHNVDAQHYHSFLFYDGYFDEIHLSDAIKQWHFKVHTVLQNYGKSF